MAASRGLLRAHLQHEGWELDTNKVSPPDHRAGCMAERRVAEGSEDWEACYKQLPQESFKNRRGNYYLLKTNHGHAL